MFRYVNNISCLCRGLSDTASIPYVVVLVVVHVSWDLHLAKVFPQIA